MALSEKLAELDASMVAAKQWVRAVGGEVRAAKAELDEARNPVVEGYAAGSDEAAISWLATEAEVMSLMRLVGRSRDRTPELPAPLAAVVRDIGRLGGTTVPAPVPGGQHRARIDRLDDPDAYVRGTARPRFVVDTQRGSA